MNNSRQRKIGVLLSYSYTIAQMVVNLLYIPILIGGLGADEYGLYQLIGSMIAYMGIMNSMFSAGVTRYYCKYLALNDSSGMESVLAVSRNLYRIVSVIAILIGFCSSLLVNAIYQDRLTDNQLDESAFMIAALVINLVVTMNNTINVAIINGHERFAFLKITQLFSVVVQPLLVIPILSIWPFAISVCCVQLLMNTLCAIAQRVYARQVLKGRIKLHSGASAIQRSLLAFSSGIVLGLVADQIFWKTNQLIIGYFSGTVAVAVYGVANQVCMAYIPVGTAVASVFMPRVMGMLAQRNGLADVSFLFIKVGRLAVYPLAAILICFCIFGQNFIALWAGEGFEESYWIALILMCAVTIDVVQNFGLTILQALNKYFFRGRVYTCMAVVNIIAVLLIVPVFGPIGAAMVTALCMVIGNGLIMNLYYAKYLGLAIREFWKNVFKVAIPMIACGCIFEIVYTLVGFECDTWLSVSVGLVVLCTLLGLTAYFFSMNLYEQQLIYSPFRAIAKSIKKKSSSKRD